MRSFTFPLAVATLFLAAAPALADDDDYGAYLFQGGCDAFSAGAVIEDVGDLDIEDDADDVAKDWARMSPDSAQAPSPIRLEDETVDNLTPDQLAQGGYAIAVTQADSRDAPLIACGEVPKGVTLPFVDNLLEVGGSGVAGRMAAETHEGGVRFTVAAFAKDAAPPLGN